ncbi:sulfurtransferase [Pseudomonas putida]
MSARDKLLISAVQLAAELAGEAPPILLVVHSPDSDAVLPRDQRLRIPGAVDTDLANDFAAPGGGRLGSRPLPDIVELQEKAQAWGIGQGRQVVVYDHDGGLQAARAWWTLRWAGVAQVRLLNGGFAAWQAAGLATAQAPGALPVRGDVVLSAGHLPQLNAAQSLQLARDGVLLDTRIRPNYQGGPVPAGQAPRGHIPGAISLPAADLLQADQTFFGNAQLRARFTALDVDDSHPVGVYCGAGVSAAHVILALACIGVQAPLYVGSWSAWSADPELPVAQGSQPG